MQYLTQDQRIRRVDLIATYLANGYSITFKRGGPYRVHQLDAIWHDEYLDRARGTFVHGETGTVMDATFTDEMLRDMLRSLHGQLL